MSHLAATTGRLGLPETAAAPADQLASLQGGTIIDEEPAADGLQPGSQNVGSNAFCGKIGG
jgi:hypothetical protein